MTFKSTAYFSSHLDDMIANKGGESHCKDQILISYFKFQFTEWHETTMKAGPLYSKQSIGGLSLVLTVTEYVYPPK